MLGARGLQTPVFGLCPFGGAEGRGGGTRLTQSASPRVVNQVCSRIIPSGKCSSGGNGIEWNFRGLFCRKDREGPAALTAASVSW